MTLFPKFSKRVDYQREGTMVTMEQKLLQQTNHLILNSDLCTACGICVEACPLGTPIHELLGLIADGQFKEAAELLFINHSIPELASHVCVGGRVCEQACIQLIT
jgi:NADPH-dependent glutamate synthase beta subunit-like oxidoreductase